MRDLPPHDIFRQAIESLPKETREQIKRELDAGRGLHALFSQPEIVRQIAGALPAEHRQRFEENIRRWQSLDPEEREYLREESRARFGRLREDVDRIVRELGLTLDPEQRARFQHRYIEEREKLERRLHERIGRMRAEEMPALLERLRADFRQPEATPTPSPTP